MGYGEMEFDLEAGAGNILGLDGAAMAADGAVGDGQA
jgi:hypothetical protein